MDTKLRLVLKITILFFSFCGLAQQSYWRREGAGNTFSSSALKRIDVKKATIYTLSSDQLSKTLKNTPAGRGTVAYFPDETGEIIPYQVTETPVMAPSLAAKYPGIRSYTGRSLRNAEEHIRFSMSHKGIESMQVHADGRNSTFIQKVAGTADQYLLYQRDDLSDMAKEFICYTGSALEKGAAVSAMKLVDDQMLRTYRIAISATGEYTQFHGGNVVDALAAINATLTRVNEVFERDLGIHLELVANADQVIFTDANTDPYELNLNSEVQETLTSVIGEANYDVGHLFHEDNNAGNAGFIGSVCRDNQKGSGYSSSLVPQGDVYDLDYVAHEIGHQFGANHTWAYESEGTDVQAEPGSGSTIMGYAGIVQGNNLQPNGDDYFHYYSIQQITEYVKGISCGVATAIPDNPPVIIPAGDFVIPKGTAFVLTGNATDPDVTDVLTYAWEQIDVGVVSASSFGPDNAIGANFRSLKPTSSPARYFPRLSEVIKGNLTQTNPTINAAWETVSEIERDLNFALTVRDNVTGGGQVVSDLVNIRVLNNAGPFEVVSQQSGETYDAGSIQTVSWNVAGTNQGQVNAQLVDIFLSTDGGLSFPVQLADATPNDGTQEVLLPGLATNKARFMVKADDNIFFAINSVDFTILQAPMVLQFASIEYDVCQPDELIIPFSFETFGGFNEEVSFSVAGAPAALGIAFSPDTVLTGTDPVTLSITNTDQVSPGNYSLAVTATSASQSKVVLLQVQFLDGSFSPVTLTSPENGAPDTSVTLQMEWNADPSATLYDLEIATDAGFSNIVETANVHFTRYLPTTLQESTTYYWRVKPENNCGMGPFSVVSSFTTVSINCQEYTADNLPIAISAIGTPTIESVINISDDLPVSDVNVGVNLDHTFVGDLIISLISPSGTEVVLTSNFCGESGNIDAVFDDDGNLFVCGINPALSGLVKPPGSLASFKGESSLGAWILRIFDSAPADGGALNDFTLELCVEGQFRPDADGDGVFDDGDDLCLGTPPGTEVTLDGCPVYRFAADTFTLAIESESCIPSNNGSIEVTAAASMDYTISVDGPGTNITEDFTKVYQLGSLSAGAYSVCITGTDGSIVYVPYCFEAVVSEPEPLSVVAKLSVDGRQALLQLSGADVYLVELNGVTRQIGGEEAVIDLKEGANTLKVNTLQPCQGTYEEVLITRQPIVFPNPFHDELTVLLGVDEEVMVWIYSAEGRQLEQRSYRASSGKLVLDFSGRAPGLYLLKIEAASIKGTFKVVKR